MTDNGLEAFLFDSTIAIRGGKRIVVVKPAHDRGWQRREPEPLANPGYEYSKPPATLERDQWMT